MTRRMLVVGDANVDLVLSGDVLPRFGQAEQLLDTAELVLGGSASIVASGLAKLGVPTSLVAVVGDDEFGRFTLAALSGAGVDVAAVSTSAAEPTGLSVILSTDSDRAILTLPGAIPQLGADRVRRAVEDLDPAHVHFASYFLLPGLAAELPDLLAWLSGRGVTTSIDTNWDPAERWEGLEAVLAVVNIVIPNLEELRAIALATGSAPGSDDERYARDLASRGATVVVKAGAAGGWSVEVDGDLTSAPGLHVDVVDTTGAGDSFDAGYLAAVAHGVLDESRRLRWAAVAGSLSVRAAGGTGAQATMSELMEHVE